MSKQSMFYPRATRAAAAAAALDKINLPLPEELEAIKFPASPIVNFHPNPCPPSPDDRWRMHFFGLSEDKIICTDSNGVSSLYDAAMRSFLAMPSLHTPKCWPISLYVPDDDPADQQQHQHGGGRLFIMEKILRRRCLDKNHQFEAFVCASPGVLFREKTWYSHSLPLPPFAYGPGIVDALARAHAVLGGGSHICVSFSGIGTY